MSEYCRLILREFELFLSWENVLSYWDIVHVRGVPQGNLIGPPYIMKKIYW